MIPLRQELQLELVPGRDTWSGSLRATLQVRRATRRFFLLLAGGDPSRVELAGPHGAVPLTYGWRGRDTLLVETAAPLAPGPLGMNVAWLGSFAAASRGPRTVGRGAIVMAPGAGGGIPLWPGVAPATSWRLTVRAPDSCTVRSNLARLAGSRQGSWRTWEFASRRPLPADSIAFQLRAGRRGK